MIKKGKGKIKEVGRIKKGSRPGEVEFEPINKFCSLCGKKIDKEQKDGICAGCREKDKKD